MNVAVDGDHLAPVVVVVDEAAGGGDGVVADGRFARSAEAVVRARGARRGRVAAGRVVVAQRLLRVDALGTGAVVVVRRAVVRRHERGGRLVLALDVRRAAHRVPAVLLDAAVAVRVVVIAAAALVLLVGVELRPVHRLDVLAQRAGVGVALGAAGRLAHVRLLVRVRPILVLGAVAGVAERLRAARELAVVGLLTGVRPDVGLQVLQSRVGLGAPFGRERTLEMSIAIDRGDNKK